MKIRCMWLIVLIVSGMLMAGTLPVEAEEVVRAKIGIQIQAGNRISRAKAQDRIEAEDLLRIYIWPETHAYVYVIHSDQKVVTLLNKEQRELHNSPLILPSAETFYQVDGSSTKELFTVICSPTELPEIAVLFYAPSPSYTEWAALEERLIHQSKINLGQQPEKPFALAGNVRGIAPPEQLDPFWDKLQTFSGRTLLVKRYEFRVKK